MNKQSVYLETSVVSYFTSLPSRDIIIAGHQQITSDWFNNHSIKYNVYISELVASECTSGDKAASRKRLSVIENVNFLEINQDVLYLSEEFIRNKIIPKRYNEDAFHIAVATIHGMDYLLTWNCKHIANAHI
jgi:hypothetical protein